MLLALSPSRGNPSLKIVTVARWISVVHFAFVLFEPGTGKLSTAGCFFKKQPFLFEFIISAFVGMKFYHLKNHVRSRSICSIPAKRAWPWTDSTENWIFPLIQFEILSLGAVFSWILEQELIRPRRSEKQLDSVTHEKCASDAKPALRQPLDDELQTIRHKVDIYPNNQAQTWNKQLTTIQLGLKWGSTLVKTPRTPLNQFVGSFQPINMMS